jgi:hypothetical protein
MKSATAEDARMPSNGDSSTSWTSRSQAEPSPTASRMPAFVRRSQTIAISPMPAADNASRWWKSTGLFATGVNCGAETPRLGQSPDLVVSVARTTALPVSMVIQRAGRADAFTKYSESS